MNRLSELCTQFGVSGSEEVIRNYIETKANHKITSMFTDAMGNLICTKKGTGEKVMLAAHMDEIGMVVTYIDENGFVRFSPIGGLRPQYALAQRVLFEKGTWGVVHHEESLDSMNDLKWSSMYIDIGATSKEEAEKYIQIGEPAKFYTQTHQQGDMIFSSALDNRAGCAVLLDVIDNLPDTDKEIYFVFTVQEEIGLRGAKTAAFNLMPDIAIAVDVTKTGDTPSCKPMAVKCGNGPAIKIKDQSILCHKGIIHRLRKVCEDTHIPYQNEILERGGTDAGAIHLTGGGIPTGAISIPCRYIHSPNEMVHVKDLQNAQKLLCTFLATSKP